MPAPIFTPQGTHKNDYIEVDGEIDWAIIPAHTLPGQKVDMPIRLRVGDQDFGEKHIYHGHADWLTKIKRSASELVWEKLSLQGGKFFKGKKKRHNLYVNLTPHCLIVLERQQDRATNTHFYSIVTMYQHRPQRHDKALADYSSTFKNPNANTALRKG
ncbi:MULTISPECIES: hypothetical protein [Vibrio]|nr:hypothetical protein [Vibrio tasmaniensis]TKG28456.1 hypothetical protein FC057_21665 [Vibrio tasmaniensis]TKG39058.1 hypothetical protein FC063_17240 [Vibrio tasmaniensis]TKG44621.1 hypothetical protein FC060_16600 [Vibrio tasmaniensis]TKG46143.1 hypothetical protein FC061_18420 [Vibrio tasmaniensis]TKG55525.1 hypothetical protein FC070_00645 [Vibrio tasmaniensis]